MSRKGSGYNNPAFCSQFDNSLYDYEYVPEIDPDSPDLQRKPSYRPPKQVPPWGGITVSKNNSDEFDNSDESNQSIVVEECNNRRVTLICEKRQPVIRDPDGGYAHNVSLESADSIDNSLPNQNRRYEHLQNKNQFHGTNRDFHGTNRDFQGITDRRQTHRYEELNGSPHPKNTGNDRRMHRYSEIDEFEAEGVHFAPRKPRAPSPQDFANDFSYQRHFSPRPDEFEESFSKYIPSSSPIDRFNEFELSDFSPPRRTEMQRQPPVGASATHPSEPIHKPKAVYKIFPRSGQRKNITDSRRNTPIKSERDKRFLISSPKNPIQILKADSCGKQSVRRNIASSFSEDNTSPYRSTTRPIAPRNTAIITPILQRKFAELTSNNFEEASKKFQSTSNMIKGLKSELYPQNNTSNKQHSTSKNSQLKRNQSVPNFYGASNRTPVKIRPEVDFVGTPKTLTNLEKHQSPVKPTDHISPMSRSRISLLDNLKTSWSNLENEHFVSPSPCIILLAIVQLLAGLISSGICFYLMSKLGRRYYLDLGMLGGFVNIVLGGLGFRANYWKWLPNRNYVSGYMVLTVFSLISCGSFILIISVRPMEGAPILDLTAGAICGISVLIIILALTGLTLSGCCKVPPPDNRVSTA